MENQVSEIFWRYKEKQSRTIGTEKYRSWKLFKNSLAGFSGQMEMTEESKIFKGP